MARLLAHRPLDRRRAHAVKLADLRVALQHLQAVGVVRDLKRRRRHHAAAAEGARLVALHAALKLLRARRAGDVVHVLLLRRRRDVQQELGGDNEHVRGDLRAERTRGVRRKPPEMGRVAHSAHLVPRHARLRRLDALVQAERLFLRT